MISSFSFFLTLACRTNIGWHAQSLMLLILMLLALVLLVLCDELVLNKC